MRMTYAEYGTEHKDAVILLHGGGLSWWNHREAAEILSEEYHVILPVLDGHAESSDDFTTIEANAERIIAFVDEHFSGSVLMMGGVSLGGQILLDILSRRRDICRYALIESAMVMPSRCLHAMIAPAFGSCYGLIRRRWFSKMQFHSLHIEEELFEEYYRDTCQISKANMMAFLRANAMYSLKASIVECCAKVHVFVGEKEQKVMHKSAALIHEKLPGSTMQVLSRMHHGEFSVNHAQEYARSVKEIIWGR